MADSFFESVRDSEGSTAGAAEGKWVPLEGDFLVGEVVRTRYVDGDYGSAFVVTVRTEGPGPYLVRQGKEEVELEGGCVLNVWATPVQLKELMAQIKPKVGERIGVKRLVDGESKAGRSYQRWDVQIDPDTKRDDDAPEPEESMAAAESMLGLTRDDNSSDPDLVGDLPF